jgi:hypothetical protein
LRRPKTRVSSKLRLERRDPLALEIQAVLDKDLADGARLMLPRYRADALKNNSLDGYCAVGAEAYFFLGGGREAGLQPMQLTRFEGSHWWILKQGTVVVDLTLRPRDLQTAYPYHRGTPRGFMQTGYQRPSKRAAEVMSKVKRRRGESDQA